MKKSSLVWLGVRIPEPMRQRLRILAAETRVSQQYLVTHALEQVYGAAEPDHQVGPEPDIQVMRGRRLIHVHEAAHITIAVDTSSAEEDGR